VPQAVSLSPTERIQRRLVWQKEAAMPVEQCIPIIPSANLEKSLRLWADGLGFSMSSEMRKDDKLIFCMLGKTTYVSY
jgi:hypothetical protein